MPILGNMNSMNEIYRNQINEILNQDREIYKKVFALESKQVQAMQPQEIVATEQLTQENLQETERAVDLLAKKLEEINNDLLLIQVQTKRIGAPAQAQAQAQAPVPVQKPVSSERYKDIMETYDVLTYYNSLMRTINNPALGQNVKSVLENAITKLIPLYQNIVYNYLPVIHKILDNNQSNIREIIPKLISAYSVFKLMLQNIQNRNYRILDINDVSQQFTDIVVKDFPYIHQMQSIHALASNDPSGLLLARYQAFRQENGRNPTEAEKQQIIKQLNLNSGLQPIFSSRTQDLLGQKINEKQQHVNMIQGQIQNVNTQLDNDALQKTTEIDNKITNKQADLHLVVQHLNHLKTLLKTAQDEQKKLNKIKENKRTEAEKQRIQDLITDVVDLNAEIAKHTPNEQQLRTEIAQLLADAPAKKAKIIQDRDNQKQAYALSVNKNMPQQQGNGKPQRKVYLQRIHNNQTEFDTIDNDPYNPNNHGIHYY